MFKLITEISKIVIYCVFFSMLVPILEKLNSYDELITYLFVISNSIYFISVLSSYVADKIDIEQNIQSILQNLKKLENKLDKN